MSAAKRKFAETIHCANSTPGMWDDRNALFAGRTRFSHDVLHHLVPLERLGHEDEVMLSARAAFVLETEGKHIPVPIRFEGLRRIGWHVLRHTFASHLVMRKAPIKAVQELMGHSTVMMTERYAHLSPDVRKDSVRLLDHVHTTSMTEVAVVK